MVVPVAQKEAGGERGEGILSPRGLTELIFSPLGLTEWEGVEAEAGEQPSHRG